MTDDEQTALSHQHSHGVWVVLVEATETRDDATRFALFDHPNGHLLCLVGEEVLFWRLIAECRDAAVRYKSRDAPRPLPSSLNLGELEIDL